jgi:hypothetical protein
MEATMNLFRLRVEKDFAAKRQVRTWLVVADSLLDAISVVPEGFSVKAITVEVGTDLEARRPDTPIASIGAPLVH